MQSWLKPKNYILFFTYNLSGCKKMSHMAPDKQVISDKFVLPDLTDFCYRQAYIANKNMHETGPGKKSLNSSFRLSTFRNVAWLGLEYYSSARPQACVNSAMITFAVHNSSANLVTEFLKRHIIAWKEGRTPRKRPPVRERGRASEGAPQITIWTLLL